MRCPCSTRCSGRQNRGCGSGDGGLRRISEVAAPSIELPFGSAGSGTPGSQPGKVNPLGLTHRSSRRICNPSSRMQFDLKPRKPLARQDGQTPPSSRPAPRARADRRPIRLAQPQGPVNRNNLRASTHSRHQLVVHRRVGAAAVAARQASVTFPIIPPLFTACRPAIEPMATRSFVSSVVVATLPAAHPPGRGGWRSGTRTSVRKDFVGTRLSPVICR